ncbi:MAG TPA: hypothetical protein VMW40_02520 [Candidatus Bathyarchaeia archaeon]|nr:hypothetical protein [Candidatus Bathyarchaeia archaeon]
MVEYIVTAAVSVAIGAGIVTGVSIVFWLIIRNFSNRVLPDIIEGLLEILSKPESERVSVAQKREKLSRRWVQRLSTILMRAKLKTCILKCFKNVSRNESGHGKVKK